MALSPGDRLGPYDVIAPVGQGGMGEVYRARDIRLDRDVALKILPESVAADPDRLMRFEREAKTLASLNHPNIAQVFGVEDRTGTKALAMEFVEGEDLSERIARGAIPVSEAVPIARQIADALEAAHEAGVVHRDLKPANIKVKADGTVKVLDFGLAKGTGPTGTASVPPGERVNSPTMTSPAMTAMGVILGTAAYMSPEQAKGRAVDQRADIWAFGCVLYEMLTGTRAFKGDDVSDTLAAVLRDAPDFVALPASTPPAIARLLRRCLEREVRSRLRSIGDARLELDEAEREPVPPASVARPPVWRQPLPLTIGVLLAVLAGFGWLRPQPASDISPIALSLLPSPATLLPRVGSLDSAPMISPDGSAVLFEASGTYYVRRLDSLKTTPVLGSERATNAAFWSADSSSVLYPVVPDGLFRVRLPAGAPERVMPVSGPTRGGSMHPDGTIVLAAGLAATGLQVVNAPGGAPRMLDLSAVGRVEALYPEFLPDSHDFLFLAQAGEGGSAAIYLATLDHERVRNTVRLAENSTAAHFTPAGGGQLLFVRDDNLYAQHLDLGLRRLTGDSRLIQEGVGSSPGAGVNLADFSVSGSGTIVWRPGIAAASQVTAFDRSGARTGVSGPPLSADSIDLAPDGRRLLAFNNGDAWLIDVGQPGIQSLPPGSRLWFADGSRILGKSDGRLWERPVVGGAPRDLGEDLGQTHALSPDGTRLLVLAGDRTIVQVLGGSVAEPAPDVFASGGAFGESFSPDGRWVVYSWHDGLFVQPFPGPGLRRQIASGATVPRWRGDGAEILAVTGDGTGVMSIPVEMRGHEPRFGPPKLLFHDVLRWPSVAVARSVPLAVTRDGSTIYWLQAVRQPGPDAIQVRTQAVR
jgi:serine/threonine protein kinase